ncbi:MAG: hypothetical protein D6726_09235 [Nitrospirae bacterium]|nr:MAG: hypothetical protein D6726_09235 [Nitrospirota bacterium]
MTPKVKPFPRSLLVLISVLILSSIFNISCNSTFQKPTTKVKNLPFPYIDVHNHIIGRFKVENGIIKTDYTGSAKSAVDMMNRLGIKEMIIMPPPFTPEHPNRFDFYDCAIIKKEFPERFAFLGGGGTLNILIQEAVSRGAVTEDMKKRFKSTAIEILSKGAVGFGEFAVEHLSLGPNHPYLSAPPDHPLFLLLADIAAEYDVPIDIHMEVITHEMPLPEHLRTAHNPSSLTPNIEGFEKLLTHNRKAKIIWSHLGWDNTGNRTLRLTEYLLEKHPNLYMSIKISPRDCLHQNCPVKPAVGIKQEWIKLMKRFPDRFMIGSDQFYLSPRSPLLRIGPPSAIPTSRFFKHLPPDLKRKIGYENALRVFKLLNAD